MHEEKGARKKEKRIWNLPEVFYRKKKSQQLIK